MAAGPNDCFVISYPKSGRTWLRFLYGKAMCLHLGLPDKAILDYTRPGTTTDIFDKNAHLEGLFRFNKNWSHDDSEWLNNNKSYKNLDADKGRFKNSKILFITRNIKDLIASYYMHDTKRYNNFSGTISEYIRSDIMGVKRIIKFYEIWHKSRNVPKEFCTFSYEDMHENTEGVLKEFLKYAEVYGVSDDTCKKAVEFSRFKNMKELERKNFFKDEIFRPRDKLDCNTYKVRRGVVNSFVEELSDVDIDYINDLIEKSGCPYVK